MVGFFGALIRFIVGILLFIGLFGFWFWVPWNDPEVPLNLSAGVTIFYGNEEPHGVVRNFILLSRASTALLISIYVFLPSLSFIVPFRHRVYNNTIAVILVAATIIFFLGGTVYESLYHR